MRSRYRQIAFLAALGFGVAGIGAAIESTSALASQPYWCLCKGVKKRFIASTRYCEHQNHVKQCSAAQFRDFNRKACASNGCGMIR